MRIYWIDNLESGNLGLMPRPKGNDWLYDELHKLKLCGVDILVSLLENSELDELDLQEESTICEELSIKFISFPIQDRSVPMSRQAFITLIQQLNNELDKGNKIVIHCRMGIGRTGMLAAGILMQRGYDVNSAFELLTNVRTISVPDTEEQVEWVQNTLYNDR
ncbi:MAG: dual specificity protein phosphatase family protein [Bacteroidota bacterium]